MLKIIPEMDYYFSKNLKKLNIDFDYQFKYDNYIENEIVYNNSFLNLLFSEEYNYDNFIVTFIKKDFNNIRTPALKRRLSSYSDFYFYLTHEDGENIFGLNDDDISFLNFLLLFKKNNLNDDLTDIEKRTPLSKIIYFNIFYKINDSIRIDFLSDMNYDSYNDFYYILCNLYNMYSYKKIISDYK